MRDWASSILKLFAYILTTILACSAIDMNILYGMILGIVFHFSLRPKLIYSHNLATISFVIFEIYRGPPVYILPILSTVIYAFITWNRKKILSCSKIIQTRYCFSFFICIFILQTIIDLCTNNKLNVSKIPVQIFGIFLTIFLISIKMAIRKCKLSPKYSYEKN